MVSSRYLKKNHEYIMFQQDKSNTNGILWNFPTGMFQEIFQDQTID
jgi:hypothetical protein